jgi:hypothetical protein
MKTIDEKASQDEAIQTCPCTGCTNPRDRIYGLCRRCRAIVRVWRVDEIQDAHTRIVNAPDTISKAKATSAWNDVINAVAAEADAWRAKYATR